MTSSSEASITITITIPAFGRATANCNLCGDRAELMATPARRTGRGRPLKSKTAPELAEDWAKTHAKKHHGGKALEIKMAGLERP